MRFTEEIVPTSHSGIRVISPYVRLSSWMATLEPLLKVGMPKSPSGKRSLGSKRVNSATLVVRKKNRYFPAGMITFLSNRTTSQESLSS